MCYLHLGVEQVTLFSLARKNIKGNFSNYLVYFISMVFSMIIYYTFVSLQYNEKIQQSISLSDTMNFMFMGSSVILLLFVSIFILYSNSFFTRRRKKEVGLYSMLGLRKRTIGRMIFYENLIMGLIALFVGILFGTLLSKLFALILIKLMGSTAIIDFSISIKAVMQTVIVFLVIILFTSIQGYRLIYRFKLIDLFHAEKKGEELPKVSLLSAFIGVILLVVSYWLILRPFPDNLTVNYINKNYGLAIVTLIIGTQLFFRSAIFYFVKLLQRKKARYYKGTNLIETSHLLYRIKGNARTLTLIALLSAATISFFAATYSGYYGNEKGSKEDVVFSYAHLSKGSYYDSEIEQIIKSDKEHPIKSRVEIPVIEVKGDLSFEIDYLTEPVKLISAKTFNEVSKALNRGQEVTILENQATVIRPRATEFTLSNFEDQDLTLHLSERTRKLRLTDMVVGSVLPFNYPDFFVIVSDETFAAVSKEIKPLNYIGYKVENEKATKETSEKLSKLIGQDFQVSSSFYSDYKQGKEGNALNLFIFGFLGLVFLAATGSIIYFKQLTEANEAKHNYEILRKIGVSKKDLRKSIAKQTLFVFGLPLIVGILHGSSILYFMSNFMSNLIGANMFVPMFTALLAFIVIYAIYYVMTVNTYNNIVNK